MEKLSEMPAVVWLKMTDYTHAWMQRELGCRWKIKDQKVVCVQHLTGARDILMEETVNDGMTEKKRDPGNCMSGTRKNCYVAGLTLDPEMMEREYHVTKELMKLFVPIECPKLTLTKDGVLRPWTLDTALTNRQANAMRNLLREEFWKAVGEFNKEYARKMAGKKYAQVDMIEDFCKETGTPDLYVESLRREWQRRVKNGKS